MTAIRSLFRLLPTKSRPASRPAPRSRLAVNGLQTLEERATPSAAPVDLGTAAQYAVLGLQNTSIDAENSTINGDVGVSRRGDFETNRNTSVNGNVVEYTNGQFEGHGKLSGSVLIKAAAINKANTDAQNAADAARALRPNVILRNINRTTTLTGNGGLNVIDIRGDVRASLILNGGADDVFIINVRGNLELGNREGLKLAGGVTADHVLYNFVGNSRVDADRGSVINGTVLAVNGSVELDGVQMNGGKVVAGGRELHVGPGTTLTQIAFNGGPVTPPTTTPGKLSGLAFVDDNQNGIFDAGEIALPNVVVTATQVDANGNPVLDSNGNPVVFTTTSGSDGTYSFGVNSPGLPPGTYTLSFAPPQGTGVVVVGTVNNKADGVMLDVLTVGGIVISDGSVGIDYNFAGAPAPS